MIIQIICKHTLFKFSIYHVVFHYQTQVPHLLPRTFRVSLWKHYFLLINTAIRDSPIQLLFAKERMFFIATSFISTFLPNSRVSVTNPLSIPALSQTPQYSFTQGNGKTRSDKFQHRIERFLKEAGFGIEL